MTVWVGRDDNKPTRMTGGTGALPIWGDMMRVMPSKPLKIGKSSKLVWVKVDSATGLLFNPACGKAVTMPFSRGTQPRKRSYCEPPVLVPTPQPAQPAAGGTWIENLRE